MNKKLEGYSLAREDRYAHQLTVVILLEHTECICKTLSNGPKGCSLPRDSVADADSIHGAHVGGYSLGISRLVGRGAS